MHIMQSRRDFLTALSAAGAATAFGSRASLADEGPPETTTLRLQRGATICVAPTLIAEELLRAEGFTDIRYVDLEAVASGEGDFDLETAAWVVSHLDVGRAGHRARRRAPRVLRAVCARAHPRHQRFEGQEGRHPPETRLERAPAACQHGCVCRPRPAHGHRLGEQPDRRLHGTVRRRESRCVSRLPAGTAAAACAQGRSGDPQYRPRTGLGRSISAASRSATASSCARIQSPPSDICALSSRLPTSAPPSPSGQHGNWSMAGSLSVTTTPSRR